MALYELQQERDTAKLGFANYVLLLMQDAADYPEYNSDAYVVERIRSHAAKLSEEISEINCRIDEYFGHAVNRSIE